MPMLVQLLPVEMQALATLLPAMSGRTECRPVCLRRQVFDSKALKAMVVRNHANACVVL